MIEPTPITLPAELRPLALERVIELVEKAGLDVSDWSNYKRGGTNPGANPKYCYEWAFKESGRLVVCNLWRNRMVEVAGEIEQHVLLRDTPEHQETNATRRARRARMEEAIAEASRDGLPIRVIVLDGKPGGAGADAKSKVTARSLDPEPWAVVSLDPSSGAAVLRRGTHPFRFVDQFSLPRPPDGPASQSRAIVNVRSRSAAVRAYALRRANGRCEYCGEPGFTLCNGSIYLETHHVVSLSNGGPDSVANVVGLCPNHHRQAHYGHDAKIIAKVLAAKLQGQNK